MIAGKNPLALPVVKELIAMDKKGFLDRLELRSANLTQNIEEVFA